MKNALCILSLFIATACADSGTSNRANDWKNINYYELACGGEKKNNTGCKTSDEDIAAAGRSKGR